MGGIFRKYPNLALGAALAAVLAVGVFFNMRIEQLREAELMYRWIVSASTQVRVFGEPGHVPTGDDPSLYMDRPLFAELVTRSDALLPDIEVTDHDLDDEGKPLPKVVRYTAVQLSSEDENADIERGTIESDVQNERDQLLYELAQKPEFDDLRAQLTLAHRDGKISSLGSTLGLEGLYADRSTSINLANMFLGFRKMAANLIWLEVDKQFHSGGFHRMLPMMNTCVMLDPSFVDAYLLGSWHLAYNATAQMQDTPYEIRTYYPQYPAWIGEKEEYYYQAVEFLKDGIRKNPRNYRLYFDLGFSIYELKLNDKGNAIKYLSEAIRLDHDRWVRRQLYRLLGQVGRLEESKKSWESYLEWQPNNEIAKRFIKMMDGAMLERSARWAVIRGNAADELAKRAQERGDATAAQEWEAKAAAANAQAKEQFQQAKAFWQQIADESKGADTFAYARSQIILGEEQIEQGRFIEAVVSFDRARWGSNEVWDEATHKMIDARKAGKLPLYATETGQIERELIAEEYTRHLPKQIAGHGYTFANGAWKQDGGEGLNATPIQQGSEEELKLLWEHPEIEPAITQLDGNIVLQAGDQWYEYRSNEPAKPSKIEEAMAS